MGKRLLKIFAGLIGLVITLALILLIAYRLLNQTNGTIQSGGENRKYLLYVPDSYNPALPAPLVISIHGFAEWPAHQMEISRWNDLAEQYGFLVVYPSGTRFPLRWRTFGISGTESDPGIDVSFISDLIDTLAQQYNIDPQRIYANGLSNGGGMSFVLSCQLADRIAAVGLVAGAYFYPWEACQPARPVPAMVFHGTEDPIVPFEGGPSHTFDLPFPIIPEWVNTLARQHGCAPDPVEFETHGAIQGVKYTGCEAEVIFYKITGGGHTWPGGEPLPAWITGKTTDEINATQLMWDFFQQHPLAE